MGKQQKQNGDIIEFIKQKDYVMLNNNLGSGSFGKTVLIKDPTIDELFVAKKYEPEYPELTDKFYDSFKQEIKIMYKLNHNNIVRIYNYYLYEESKLGYIIMEYVEGKSIANVFQLEPNEFADTLYTLDNVFTQLIDAFHYLEIMRILHRDIREGNILINEWGGVKIIDFGLGKIFTPIEKNVADSKNSKNVSIGINRTGLDRLPNEYYEGTYTHQTDMFYLAELFNRLMNKNDFANTFSYQSILNKMMEADKNKRYESFKKIKEAINKKDFDILEISETDKEIYQAFTSKVYESLSVFLDEKKFNNQPSSVIKKLTQVLKENCFETYVQQNNDIIRAFVVSGFRYNNDVSISLKTVKEFRDWLQNLSVNSQQLVVDNIIKKLSNVTIVESEPELPF